MSSQATIRSDGQVSNERGLVKSEHGTVVSNKMDKSAVVAVVRQVKHKRYGKYIKRTKKYLVHDEQNSVQLGDTVRIVETSPISRNKHWRIIEILTKAND